MPRRRNYPLVVYGNPGGMERRGVVLSRHVHAVLYCRLKDRRDYVHGFGNADITISERGGKLTLGGLKASTDVEMIGLDDGSILIRGTRGQPVWESEDDD